MKLINFLIRELNNCSLGGDFQVLWHAEICQFDLISLEINLKRVRSFNYGIPRLGSSLKIIAVVRQQFVIGMINCSVFLYRNSFGANQHLALTRKSFRIVQVSHCATQWVQQSANVLQ